MFKKFTIVFCLSFFIQTCTISSEPGDQNLSIREISIRDNDSLSHGAGIIIKFSNAIDLSSFIADTIYKQFDLYFNTMSNPSGLLFTHLPGECTIIIKDINNLTLKAITHTSGGSELWDLKYDEDEFVGSGIYKYEITNSETNYPYGIFVVN